MAITPMTEEPTREFAAERKLPFDLLSDPGNRVAAEYGLVYTVPDDLREVYRGFGIDVSVHNGDDSWSLPMPARYVIGTDGVVRWASVSPDYTERPEPEETLAAL